MKKKIYVRGGAEKGSPKKKPAKHSLKIHLHRQADKVAIIRPVNKELALYMCHPDFQNDSKAFWEKYPKEMERLEREGGSFDEEQPAFFDALQKFSNAHKGLTPIRSPLTLDQLFFHLSFEDSRFVGPITLGPHYWDSWGCKVVIPIHLETTKEDILAMWGAVEQTKVKVYGKDHMDKRKRDEFIQQVEVWIWRSQQKSFLDIVKERPGELKTERNKAMKQFGRAFEMIMGKKYEGSKIRSQIKKQKLLDYIGPCKSCADKNRAECRATGHLCLKAFTYWDKMDRKESFIRKKYISRDEDGKEIDELERRSSDIENPEEKIIRIEEELFEE